MAFFMLCFNGIQGPHTITTATTTTTTTTITTTTIYGHYTGQPALAGNWKRSCSITNLMLAGDGCITHHCRVPLWLLRKFSIDNNYSDFLIYLLIFHPSNHYSCDLCL